MYRVLSAVHVPSLQGLSGSDVENVGYVIPTPVVNHFLTDYLANGKFTGFPALGVQWQRMESDALKQAYNMKPGQKGGFASVLLSVVQVKAVQT